jgi:hypothetical protein
MSRSLTIRGPFALAIFAGLMFAPVSGTVHPASGAAAVRSSGKPDATFVTRGRVTRLAADGFGVAVATVGDGRSGCDQIVVWPGPGREARRFQASGNGCDSIVCQPSKQCVDELAVGDERVAWIERAGGNSLELRLHVARLSGGRERELELAVNNAGAAESPEGSWIGHLHGAGSLLVYNRWRFVCDAPPDFECGSNDPNLQLVDQRLVRIRRGRRIIVKSGVDVFPLRAVGGGRMAVESGDVVTILARDGSPAATVSSTGDERPRAIALSVTQLALQHTNSLDLYDPATGEQTKSLQLGRYRRLDLAGVGTKLALLRGPRQLVAVRLRDGRVLPMPLRSGTTLVDAKMTGAGAFYAYNLPHAAMKGRVVYQSVSTILGEF